MTMTTHASTAHGNSALLTAAINQFDELIRAVPTACAHESTPCPDYDITELTAHVAVVIDRLAHALGAEHPDHDSAPDWTSARDRAIAAIAVTAPGMPVSLPFGTMPAQIAYGVLLGELTTHAWDLAVAIRRTDLLDQSLGAAAATLVVARIPEQPRDAMPFGPVVPIAFDAPPYDRLAGWRAETPRGE
ncbi:MAG: TIGR03086 family protein [Pseudonocardiales bacterium]|nr:MAG: TIGR03086 family protein [Pseudonocardiales bacterium]